jgi:hypothetical protein
MSSRSKEHDRLAEKSEGETVPHWMKWGPYVAERAWGTVREDYSWNGDAWGYFPFEQSNSKVYRWGDDGIAGWCDRYQFLLFAPAFWNGKDPFLKERLFGLSSTQGNHGEDVKECYFHLDGTPTHSYMKYLYKYPQEAFPYQELRAANQFRGAHESEFELVDTGIFADNRYFDIVIEYAKASPEDLCIRIEAFNRGDQDAPLHILPHLWFRNQWSWGDAPLPEPIIEVGSESSICCLVADDIAMQSPPNLKFDYHVGKRFLYGPKGGKLLFTNNENPSDRGPYTKDAFHRAVVDQEASTNPEQKGTKACLHYVFEKVPAKGSVVLHLRLTDRPMKHPLENIDAIFAERIQEADAFYAAVHPKHASEEEKNVQRQALAGMIWNKQIYLFDVNLWLNGDNSYQRPPPSRLKIRNVHWRHLNSMRILLMPDKWEYPWFAAWDLAFHCLTYSLIDINFAKEELWLLLFDQFQHPNGEIPAYEWEFSDLNPPLQAWAAYKIYEMEKAQTGKGDEEFLRKCFLKLCMNFIWWVNKVDSSGNNVFEGGFLGLDNITLIDRSKEQISGAVLRQSDGTGWMAMFCLNLMKIALELAKTVSTYEAMATKFFQHFVYIANAMKRMGNQNYELWSESDQFFYDVLSYPDGHFAKFRVRSLVGLIPLFAVETLSEEELSQFPNFKRDFEWFLENRKDLTEDNVIPIEKNQQKGYLLSLVNEEQLHGILKYVWDPEEFRSPFGLRSLSKFHEKNPFFYQDKQVKYEPGDSLERIKGGNSNWRGPIWAGPTYMLTESLMKFSSAMPDSFKVSVRDLPPVSLREMAKSFAGEMISIFVPNKRGVRPFWGENFPFAQDPHWRDHILFNEFFHGETGKGLGASHQSGWTSLVANFIDEYRKNL